MNLCKDCKYWERLRSCFVAHEKSLVIGKCTATPHFWTSTDHTTKGEK